jgi:hypothetical protein
MRGSQNTEFMVQSQMKAEVLPLKAVLSVLILPYAAITGGWAGLAAGIIWMVVICCGLNWFFTTDGAHGLLGGIWIVMSRLIGWLLVVSILREMYPNAFTISLAKFTDAVFTEMGDLPTRLRADVCALGASTRFRRIASMVQWSVLIGGGSIYLIVWFVRLFLRRK